MFDMIRAFITFPDVVVLFDQPQTDILLALWVHDGVSTLRQWGVIRAY